MNCIDIRPYARPLATPGFAASARHLFRAFLARLQAGLVRYRQRRALLRLSDEALKDIGISRAEALEEGLEPFWREPRVRR